jgi:hypothetical protein
MREAIYEPDDDRLTVEEQHLEAYRTAVAHLDPADVWAVVCATLTDQPPAAVLEWIATQQREPYPTHRPWVTPAQAQAIAVGLLPAIQEALDALAGLVTEGRG